MSPESAVLTLVRAALHPDAFLDAAALAQVDWRAAVALAAGQGVGPLMADIIASRHLDVPPEFARRLTYQTTDAAAKGVLLERGLSSLLQTLDEHGLAAIVLKGPALAHALYPRPELRPYGDLDVLVHPTDYARLYRTLLGEGYTSGDVEGALKRNPSPLESYFPRPFTAPSGRFSIEAHFDVLQLGLVERCHASIWQEACLLDTGSLRMPVLAPPHQVLHLAAHVHRHGYHRLIWLVDLDLAVRQYWREVDWPLLLEVARAEGMSVMLRYALAVAATLLDTPRPPLPPLTPAERLLGAVYRRLWPIHCIGGRGHGERQRLVRFYPETGRLMDSIPGLLLVGRRCEKWQIVRSYLGRVGR